MRIHLPLVLATLLLAHAPLAAACDEHELDKPDLVQVIQPTLTATKTDGPVMVSVLGTFRNTSPNRVDNLVVEAKLTDAQGKLIDVLSQPVYGVTVPAGQEVAFRIQGPAAAPQASYAGVQARVASGETHIARQPRPATQEASPWLGVAISWGPMILLILVWVVLARKYSGRGSTQDKMLLAVNEQNALLARQLTAIESIAQAAKSPPQGES